MKQDCDHQTTVPHLEIHACLSAVFAFDSVCSGPDQRVGLLYIVYQCGLGHDVCNK